MKVRIPLMIQDPTTTRYHKLEKAVEGFDPDREEYFLDGPVTRRIAVLDFSPVTGELVTGAKFMPPPPRRVRGMPEALREVVAAREAQLLQGGLDGRRSGASESRADHLQGHRSTPADKWDRRAFRQRPTMKEL